MPAEQVDAQFVGLPVDDFEQQRLEVFEVCSRKGQLEDGLLDTAAELFEDLGCAESAALVGDVVGEQLELHQRALH